jgi:hypothetical protein
MQSDELRRPVQKSGHLRVYDAESVPKQNDRFYKSETDDENSARVDECSLSGVGSTIFATGNI